VAAALITAILFSPSAKPQARFLQFRDELLPTETYRKLHTVINVESREGGGSGYSVSLTIDCEERLGTSYSLVENNKPYLASAYKSVIGSRPIFQNKQDLAAMIRYVALNN
jgi:hypothetical protein